jgi:predicted MFS family arabinose efflux permease
MAHSWPLLALALIPAGLACAPTVAQTVVAVSHAVPESARGEAIGLHSAALTLGNALGAPLAGAVIDHSSPAFGFASVGFVGAAGALAAGGAAVLRRIRLREAAVAAGVAGVPDVQLAASGIAVAGD